MTFKKLLLIGLIGIGLTLGLTGCEGWISITINQPPVAVFSASPTKGYAKLNVSFDASASYDQDGWIVDYSWDFGDGTTGSGVMVTHLYEDDSDRNNDRQNEGYTAVLTVIDDDGAQTFTYIIITVKNPLPIANFSWSPAQPFTSEIVVFDASPSYDPAVYQALGIIVEPAKIIDYYWDFGDGITGERITVSHKYAENGRYLVTLTVTDDDFEIGSSSQVIEVLNQPPVANFTWRDCYLGGIPLNSPEPEGIIFTHCVEFDASASSDPDGEIVSYQWDFGDGKTASSKYPVIQHEFIVDPNTVITYTVKLTITDNDGAEKKAKQKIRL